MFTRIRLLGLTLVLLSQQSLAQDFLDRDSLWSALQKSPLDSTRVQLFIQLGQQFENNDPDSAIALYEAALKLSQELNYPRGVISYYTNVTYVYNALGRFDTSLVLNLKSVEIARAFGNKERIGACLANAGSSYMQLGMPEKAIEYFLSASAIYEPLGLEPQLGILYSNLCNLYEDLMQTDKSIEYGLRSLDIARRSDNPGAIINTQINLAVVYNVTGQYDKTVAALTEVQNLARQTDNKYALLLAALNLGDAYRKSNNTRMVTPVYREALQLAEEFEDRESIAIALRGVAFGYMINGDLKMAEQYIYQALDQARKYNFRSEIKSCYDALSESSLMRGDLQEHMNFALKRDSMERMLFNESIARNVQDLEAKYESEKKEQQISQLEQQRAIQALSLRQNNLTIALLAGALVSIVAIMLLYRRSTIQKKKILEQEIDQLKKQRQLEASQALIKGQEDERGRLARDLHDGLGGLLTGVKFSLFNMKSNVVLDAENRLAFERSLDMLDHSIVELRRVAHNMMPDVLLKFGLSEALSSYCSNVRESGITKLDFQAIGMIPRLDPNTEIILYRVVQELLNNAVKHASPTHVLVQLAYDDNLLSITVEDDGKGFVINQLDRTSGSGWSNIKSRITYLEGTVDIQSSPGKGTSVHITVKTP